MIKLELSDGKYTILYNGSTPFQFEALRNGEPWRDLVGDNLVLALVHRIIDLQEELAKKI
jgi:hypothetical protein